MEDSYLVVHSCGKEYRYPRSKYRDCYQMWPIPEEVEKGELTISLKKAEDFTRWAVNHLQVHPLEFFSGLRRRDIVKVRSLIAYALRCQGARVGQIGQVLKRDRSSVKNLFSFAIREWGERLDPVESLLLDYELYLLNKA